MSVSSPFIHRPIATSLLGIAVMLGGALGYWWLPVSALPQVDFPTIQVTTQLPGASPDTIASLVTAPLERQFGQIPALATMTSASSFGISQVTLQFDLEPRHRRRRAGRAVGDQCRRLHAAAQPALPAALLQGEPGRRPDHHAGAHLGDYRPANFKRHGRHHHGAAAGGGDRRRPRLGAGRHPPGDPHPGRSVAAGRLWHRAGGPALGHRRRQRGRRQGLARRRASVLHHRRQRPDHRRGNLQIGGGGVPQRRAGAGSATSPTWSTGWKTPRSAPPIKASRRS